MRSEHNDILSKNQSKLSAMTDHHNHLAALAQEYRRESNLARLQEEDKIVVMGGDKMQCKKEADAMALTAQQFSIATIKRRGYSTIIE